MLFRKNNDVKRQILCNTLEGTIIRVIPSQFLLCCHFFKFSAKFLNPNNKPPLACPHRTGCRGERLVKCVVTEIVTYHRGSVMIVSGNCYDYCTRQL